jgi:hypothetical protein
MPDARCTRGLVCNVHRRVRTRAYRAAESIRHSLRNGFTAYNELSPVIGFLATVIGGTALDPLGSMRNRQLDASTEASGPHVFAVRVGAVRRGHLHVHRNPPLVGNDGRRPSEWDGMAIDVPLICPSGKAKYF